MRDYLILAMSYQDQASFDKCYSKLLFGFDGHKERHNFIIYLKDTNM